MKTQESTGEQFVDVETNAGTVRGKWRQFQSISMGAGSRSAAFLGIPFAEPPVGELRFLAPIPKKPWDGVLEALEYGATAQRGDPGETLVPEPSVPGQSTLNVNVFTPSPSRKETESLLPVLVWIHGGGYTGGSPASPWYDGRAFNRDDVVTVTVSYRLGFDGFGWMEDAPMNRGVLDWLLALEWVQENIANFGGNPDRVTIAGQSAGGGAVLTLLGMERAQPLFHQVYAMSGAMADVSMTSAEALGRKMAEQLGIPPTRQAWSSIDETDVLQCQVQTAEMGPRQVNQLMEEGLPLGPVVDGTVLLRPTMESIKRGVGSDKALVLGATDDEFTMAALELEKKLRFVPKSMLLGRLGLGRAQRKQYLADNPEVAANGNAKLMGRIFTDKIFRRLVVQVAKARGAAPTWVYRFTWPSGTFGFAEHCIDIPFFFDCLDGPRVEPVTGPNPPQALAEEIHGDAVRFIKEGTPGWPRYSPDAPVSRIFDSPSYNETDAYRSLDTLLH